MIFNRNYFKNDAEQIIVLCSLGLLQLFFYILLFHKTESKKQLLVHLHIFVLRFDNEFKIYRMKSVTHLQKVKKKRNRS